MIDKYIYQNDYYPFGMMMVGRSFSSERYRFGFNGKENDIETQTQDYGFRIYYQRLGKFLSIDPLVRKFAFYSPYHFCGNKPIVAVDLDGREDLWIHMIKQSDGSYLQVENVYEVNEATRQSLAQDLGFQPPSTGVLITTLDENNQVVVVHYNPTVEITENRYTAFEKGIQLAGKGLRAMERNLQGHSNDPLDGAINSVSFGLKTKLSYGAFEYEFEAGVYSTSENSAGVYFQKMIKSDLSIGNRGNSLSNKFSFTPSIFLKANTQNLFTVDGTSTDVKSGGSISASYSGYGISGKSETSLISGSTNKSISLDYSVGVTGGTTKVGISAIKKELYKSDQVNLSGNGN